MESNVPEKPVHSHARHTDFNSFRYHFDAKAYDIEFVATIKSVASHIPFRKFRTGLDVGAGGGSMAVALSQMFQMQMMSLVSNDW